MVTLDDNQCAELEGIAVERGITIQQLLRAVIIPEWIKMKEEFQEPPEEVVEAYRRRTVKKPPPPVQARAAEEANPL